MVYDEYFLKKEKHSMLENPYITENDEDTFQTASLPDQQQNGASQNIQHVSSVQPPPENIQVADSESSQPVPLTEEQRLQEILESAEYKEGVRKINIEEQDKKLEEEFENSRLQYSEPEAATSIDLGYGEYANIPPQKPRTQSQIQAHAMNRFIQKYGMNHEITTPNMTGRLRKEKNIPSFDSVEEAETTLRGDTTYFLKPPTEHMDGQFMTTLERPPSIDESFSDLWDDISKMASEGYDVARRKFSDLDEAANLGVIHMAKGMLMLPLYLDQYLPRAGTLGRLIGDFGGLIDYFKSHETYMKDINTPLTERYFPLMGFVSLPPLDHDEVLAKIQAYFDPIEQAIEISRGSTEFRDWDKSIDTTIMKYFTEILSGGPSALVKAPKAIIKTVLSPIQTAGAVRASVISLKNISSSQSIASASMHAIKATTKKSELLIREADAALAATGALVATQRFVGPENPYADLFALPAMLAAGVAMPGHRVVPYGKKAYLNHKVSLLSWWYGGFKGFKNPDTGRLQVMPSPRNNPDKVREIRKNFLLMKGKTQQEVQEYVKLGDDELLRQVGLQKISSKEAKELEHIYKAIERLRNGTPKEKAEHAQLVARMDYNFKVYTNLQRLAIKALPPGSRQKVDIYINQLTELTQFDALQAHFTSMSEGTRFFRMNKIDLRSTIFNIHSNQQRLRKANVDLLKEITADLAGEDNSELLKQFVNFMHDANANTDIVTSENGRTLFKMLEQHSTRIDSAAKEVNIGLANILHPKNQRKLQADGVVNYPTGQRAVLDRIRQEDINAKDAKYNALGNFKYLKVDTTAFRDTLASKLGLLDVGDDVLDADTINTVSTFAKTHLTKGSAKNIANEMTENTLKSMDKDDLVDTLNTMDNNAGLVEVDDAGEMVFKDRSGRTDKQLRAEIISRGEESFPLVPAEIQMSELIDLMSALGEKAMKDVGTKRGRAFFALWEDLSDYIDPLSDSFKKTATGMSPKEYENAVLAFQSVKHFFRTEFVPRYKEGLGKILQEPKSKSGVPNEGLFQQIFKDAGDIVDKAHTFKLLMTKMEKGPNGQIHLRDDETVRELLTFTKYGLWRQLADKGLTPVQVDTILLEYGGKKGAMMKNEAGQDVPDILARTDFLEMMDPKLKAALQNYKKVNMSDVWDVAAAYERKEINSLMKQVKDIENIRYKAAGNSAMAILANTDNPAAFFTKKDIIVKGNSLTPSQRDHYFKGLEERLDLGKFGDESEKARKAIEALKGEAVGDFEIAMTPLEFMEMATNNFTLVKNINGVDVNVGQQLKQRLREVYAKDIINNSIKTSGSKQPFVQEVTGRPFAEEIIDFTAFEQKLKDTWNVRQKLFTKEENAQWRTVLEQERVLLPSTTPPNPVHGLPTPHQISSWMARFFSIARGVLSLRYFAGETAINHYRLGYVKTMEGILTNPKAAHNIMEMLGQRQGHKRYGYKQGIQTIATFMGIEASNLEKKLNREEYEHLIKTGDLSDKLIGERLDEGGRKHNIKTVEKELSKYEKIDTMFKGSSLGLEGGAMFQPRKAFKPSKDAERLREMEHTLKTRHKQLIP